ncbi:uncharacterized protein V1510DRAFT_422070 [Dipodascopsis tothii]|uniref:uncharacterized protein n=1 Tax=Dipodascopsis tothii TaxID=44089 RepID=UPI0034CF27CE
MLDDLHNLPALPDNLDSLSSATYAPPPTYSALSYSSSYSSGHSNTPQPGSTAPTSSGTSPAAGAASSGAYYGASGGYGPPMPGPRGPTLPLPSMSHGMYYSPAPGGLVPRAASSVSPQPSPAHIPSPEDINPRSRSNSLSRLLSGPWRNPPGSAPGPDKDHADGPLPPMASFAGGSPHQLPAPAGMPQPRNPGLMSHTGSVSSVSSVASAASRASATSRASNASATSGSSGATASSSGGSSASTASANAMSIARLTNPDDGDYVSPSGSAVSASTSPATTAHAISPRDSMPAPHLRPYDDRRGDENDDGEEGSRQKRLKIDNRPARPMLPGHMARQHPGLTPIMNNVPALNMPPVKTGVGAPPPPAAAGSKPRKMQCPDCSGWYANLVAHRSTHLSDTWRPHMCEVCARGFSRPNDLLRHQKSHQGDSPFNCPFHLNDTRCHPTGGFSRCDTYKNHLKAMHFEYPVGTRKKDRSGVPGKCKGCNNEFPTADEWITAHVEKKTCSALDEADDDDDDEADDES